MPSFEILKSNNDLKEIIKTAFDASLDISGDWGYTQESATVIHSSDIPLGQFEHMFASMRAYIEMNMTLSPEKRYGSINLNEADREQIRIGTLNYDKVTYTVTAIKEQIYNLFINEYKEGYGKAEFDMTAHFNKRKEATLAREVIHWFQTPSNN